VKSVAGIDPNPEMLEAAKKFVPSGTFLHGTVEDIPLEDNSFDIVFMGHVLHESDDIIKALAEAQRVARQKVLYPRMAIQTRRSRPP